MKILLVAPYIYINEIKRTRRNNTGLAHMVKDIVEMLNKNGQEVFVLTQSILTTKKYIGGFVMISRTVLDIIRGFDLSYLRYASRIILIEKLPIIRSLKIIVYFMTGKHMERVIKGVKPDVVHIHTITLYTIPFILACIETNTNFVITLHGLLSFNETVPASNFEKKMERLYLKFCHDKKMKLTVISTGIKKRIEKYIGTRSDNIKVVLNAVSISKRIEGIKSLSEKYIMCVGSITKRKNQYQLVRAYSLLSDDIRSKYKLLLVGDGQERHVIERYISNNNLMNVDITGFLPRSEVINMYYNAKILVLASVDEGFGLPVIEAFSCGVPVVAFSDLDAIHDLYNEDVMMLAERRNDHSLADAIIIALNREWDKQAIVKFSENFNFSKTEEKYVRELSEIQTCDIDETEFKNLINCAIM